MNNFIIDNNNKNNLNNLVNNINIKNEVKEDNLFKSEIKKNENILVFGIKTKNLFHCSKMMK